MSTQPKPSQCRHLFTDGRQCGSRSLRNENFCYYHHTTRVPAPRPSAARRMAGEEFELPMPENRAAIQHSLGEVLRRVAALQIEHKTAALLFYGLSIASANLPRPVEADTIAIPETEPVTEIVIDPEEGLLAPHTRIEQGQKLIAPGRLLREERIAFDRSVRRELEQIDARQLARRAAATATVTPPNTPELDRLLRLVPSPFTPVPEPRAHEKTPPQPWQRAAETPASKAQAAT